MLRQIEDLTPDSGLLLFRIGREAGAKRRLTKRTLLVVSFLQLYCSTSHVKKQEVLCPTNDKCLSRGVGALELD
jgi:hypothetical protein